MSKHNNVNPDHYKVAGRERQGHDVVRTSKPAVKEDKARERWQRSPKKAGSKVGILASEVEENEYEKLDKVEK